MKNYKNWLKMYEGAESNATDESANKKVRSACVIIMLKYGFFSDVLCKLKIVSTRDVKTMATDGKYIYFNPEFTDKLKVGDIIWVICHEIMHNVLLHFDRQGGRDAVGITDTGEKVSIWNVAGDYAINLLLSPPDTNGNIIAADQIGRKLESCLWDAKYLNMSTEVIYDLIMEEIEKKGGNQGGNQGNQQGKGGKGGPGLSPQKGKGGGEQGSGELKPEDVMDPGSGKGIKGKTIFDGEKGSCDDEFDGENEGKKGKPGQGKPGAGADDGSIFSGEVKTLSDAKNEEDLKKMWEDIRRNASSTNMGTMPAGMQRYFHKLLKPKVNWKRELQNFIATVYDNFDYQRLNRRSLGRGEYLPGIKQDEAAYEDVVIAIDTSGSIDDESINKFITEVVGIVKSKEVKNLHIIWCDSSIPSNGGVQTFDVKNPFHVSKVAPRGGGGTSLIPPFWWVNENIIKKGKEPAFFVYFTDAYAGDEFPHRDRTTTYKGSNFKITPYAHRVFWIITNNDMPLEFVKNDSFNSRGKMNYGKQILIDKLD